MITHLNTSYENEGKVYHKGFADHLLSKVKSVDPGARVLLSGGVVRSLLGYIYQKVYNAKLKNPGRDILDILNSIASGKDEEQLLQLLEAFRALGIGSDMDVLVIPGTWPGSLPSSSEHAAQVKKVNSARVHLHIEKNRDPLVASMFPYGDVNLYSEQTERAIRNGGSTLDYLAFDLETRKFQTPEEYRQIVSQFIQGQYDFVPGTKREDSDATIIRAYGPRLEIPFLDFTASGRKQYLKELEELNSRLNSRGSLSEGAMQQLEKRARNARMGGAKNRLYESTDPIDVLMKKIVLKVGTGDKGVYTIPKFIRKDHPVHRKIAQKLPENLLISMDEFKKDYTENGILYHGTPDVNNLLKMIRNGMVLSVSSEEFRQGTAAKGPGAYTTQSFAKASEYVGNAGVVIPLELKQGVKINIIDWAAVKDKLFIKQLEEYARSQKPKMHVFEVLARDYGIDIIIDEFVLIQNSSVLKLPKALKDLIQFQASTLERHFVNGDTEPPLGKLLINYRKIYELAKMRGQSDLIPPEMIWIRGMERLKPEFVEKITGKASGNTVAEFQKLMEGILDHYDPAVPGLRDSLYFLQFAPPENQFILFNKALGHKDVDLRARVAQFLSTYSGPHAESLFEQALVDLPVRESALASLIYYSNKDSGLLLEKLLRHSDPRVKVRAFKVLKDYRGPHKDEFIDLALDLHDAEFGVVIHALDDYQGKKPEALFTKALGRAESGSEGGNDAAFVFGRYLQRTQNKELFLKMINHSNPVIQRNAIFALRDYEVKDNHNLFESWLKSKDERIRQAAAHVLRHYNGSKPNEVFGLALGDDSEFVRERAIESLYYYDGPGKMELILNLSKNSDPSIKIGMLKSFPQKTPDYGFEEADRDILCEVVTSFLGKTQDISIRSEAINHLNICKVEVRLEIYPNLLKDSDSSLRLALVRLMGQKLKEYGSNGGVWADFLTIASKDKDANVRAEVAASLSNGLLNFFRKDISKFPYIPKRKYYPIYEELLKDTDERVWKNIQKVLQGYLREIQTQMAARSERFWADPDLMDSQKELLMYLLNHSDSIIRGRVAAIYRELQDTQFSSADSDLESLLKKGLKLINQINSQGKDKNGVCYF